MKQYIDKNQLMQSFTASKTYLGSEIVERIKNTEIKPKKDFSVTELRKYDVIILPIAFKQRPCVVVKIIKDNVYSIPVTSDINRHSGIPFKCRFLGDGFITTNFEICSLEYAVAHFAGIFSDKASLKKAIENLKYFVTKF